MNSKLLYRIALILSFGGIFVAGFLTVSHLQNLTIPCGASRGCEVIQYHPSSKWLGIPVAAYGLAAYITLAALILARLLQPVRFAGVSKVVLGITGLGSLISFYLIHFSLFVLNAECRWCIASASIMVVLLLVSAAALQVDEPAQISQGDEASAPSAPSGGFSMDAILAGVCLLCSLGAIGVMANNSERTSVRTVAVKGDVSPSLLLTNPDMFQGPPEAPLTIVEFADLYCPACRAEYPKIRELMRQYTGKIRWGFGHFPLMNHEGHELSAEAASIAIYALQNGKYWQFIDNVMNTPEDKVKDSAGLIRVAADCGLNTVELQKLLKSGSDSLVDPLSKMQSTAITYGVNGTPTYFIFAKGRKASMTLGNIEKVLNTDYRKELGMDGP
ncbi:MAG: vitamin K epoxide reductase family protein [Armatimonadetes bacterium]|nr:vitamin K epoxide reductase family protein [Armatimonadota bacterium]